jgi:hypothetical protein
MLIAADAVDFVRRLSKAEASKKDDHCPVVAAEAVDNYAFEKSSPRTTKDPHIAESAVAMPAICCVLTSASCRKE